MAELTEARKESTPALQTAPRPTDRYSYPPVLSKTRALPVNGLTEAPALPHTGCPVPSTSTPKGIQARISDYAIKKSATIERFGQIFPGAATWLIISVLFWGPLILPWPVALAVVIFDLYWFGRSLSSAHYAIKGFNKLKETKAINWRAEYEKALDDGRVDMRWEDVHHIVVIPNLNERIEKLRLTLQHLADQEDVAQQITVVLAMEAKEADATEKSRMLLEEFRGNFAHIFATLHPDRIPGEVAGKSPNEAWAVRWAKRRLVDELGYDIANITISSCDADSLFHPRYFSALTYHFSTDPNRYRRFWQAPIFLYNNIWEVPMPIRVISALSTVNFLADLCKPQGLAFPQSTYTLSLQMCDEVDYWDVDVIPEDWHMFLKCFFHLNGEVNTVPIFLPVGADAVHAETYKRSLISRYKQAKRHAWGAEDIAYASREFLLHPEIPLFKRSQRVWALVENHLLWSTHWFLLTLGGFLPALLALPLQDFGPGIGLPQVVSFILTVCLAPGVVVVAIDNSLRPAPPNTMSKSFVALTHAQWFLLPVISALFASLPALHAQTQLMLGKPLAYEVTEKV